jgi:hypothetical protein
MTPNKGEPSATPPNFAHHGFAGVWVPVALLEAAAFKQISVRAALLCGHISALEQNHGYAWAGDGYLCDAMQCSRSRIQEMLVELENFGFIEIDGDTNQRVIRTWSNPDAYKAFSKFRKNYKVMRNLSGKPDTQLVRKTGQNLSGKPDTYIHSNKNNNTGNTSPSVPVADDVGGLFGKEDKDSITLAATRLAEQFLRIANEHKLTAKLNPKQRDPQNAISAFKQSLRDGVTEEELAADLAAYAAYLQTEGVHILTCTAKKFLERRQDIENAIKTRNTIAARGNKTAAPIDDVLKSKVESAYRKYCAEEGTPEWPAVLKADALDALTRSVANFKAFKHAVHAAYDDCVTVLESGKPARDASEYPAWSKADVFCKTVNRMTFFEHNLSALIAWWIRAMKKQVKEWKGLTSVGPLVFKPESKLFREYAITLGHTAEELDRIINHTPSAK